MEVSLGKSPPVCAAITCAAITSAAHDVGLVSRVIEFLAQLLVLL